jgi:uncharacterized protein (DUF433 family)
MKTEEAIHYPHITSTPDVAGGSPVIAGTRTPVRTIAAFSSMGMTVDEILLALKHLMLAEVYAALAYYYDHKETIDAEIALNNDIDYWRSQIQQHPGALHYDRPAAA